MLVHQRSRPAFCNGAISNAAPSSIGRFYLQFPTAAKFRTKAQSLTFQCETEGWGVGWVWRSPHATRNRIWNKVRQRSRSLWLAPRISISGLTRFSEHAQSVRFVRFDRKSVNRGLPFWTGPEVSILNVDQKERALGGREWSALITAVALSGHVPICNLKASNQSSVISHENDVEWN